MAAKRKPEEPAAQAIIVPSEQRTGFTDEQLDLIKRTICDGATNDELQLFILQCKRTGLDPFSRQIHAVRRQGKMVIQVGIDGYRLVADRTGCYAGNDDPVFDDEDQPRKATVTVWKIVGGVRCPFTASARWGQYYPGPRLGFMWDKMPHLMLGKCAESLALRKAFPAELSGLYAPEEIREEVPEADEPAPASKPATVKAESPPSPDFVAGLRSYDARLSGQGLCQAGDLVKFVATAGKMNGMPANMATWDEGAVKIARNWTKAFEAGRRLHATIDAEMRRTGVTVAQLLANAKAAEGVALDGLDDETLRRLIAWLAEQPVPKSRRNAS